MAFVFKFNGFSYQGLVKFLNEGSGKAYMDRFSPTRQLIIYPKDNPFATPVYLLTDVDVFPPRSTHVMVKGLFESVDQTAFAELCQNLTLHSLEGEVSLVGQDALNKMSQ